MVLALNQKMASLTPPRCPARINCKLVVVSEKRLNMAEIKEVTLDEVQEALRDVYDPEIPVNVLDLGLIYDIKIDNGQVYVQMTLTAPGCGMGPYIAQNAEWRIAEIEGVEDVEVDMVFDPPWNPELITEDGKKLLGLD